ncbi:MAG: sulfatase family protein [Jatrophihabitans sp.]|uniref:sulfatase family protein n=1 Tax=Jatrophihabitans sp. TaxID=1932789 RepID=UPI003F8009B6
MRDRWRRLVVTGAAGLAAVTALGACTSSPRPAPARVSAPPVYSAPADRPALPATPDRPNIVFVLTDDLSSELLRWMPAVQALERRGTTFRDYIVSDSLCCPSRTSIFTGNYPHTTGVVRNVGADGGLNAYLAHGDGTATFATALRAAGYRTAFMGKYLNGYEPGTPQGPAADPAYVPSGWDEWDGVGNGYRGFHFTIDQNHQLVSYPRAPQYYLTTVLQQRAEQFMRTAAQQRSRYLLEVATFTPHDPYVPAPADRRKFPGAQAPRTPAYDRLPRHAPRWLATRPPLSPLEQRRIDHVERLRIQDVQSIDRLLTGLERTAAATGQADRTIFVFSSDNGLHLGQYRLQPGKMTAYDTDIRVPLVIAGPGVRADQVRDELAQNIDLAPTFEQLGGATPPTPVEGRSLLPLLTGAHPAWRAAALVEHQGPVQTPGDPDLQAANQGNPTTYAAIRTHRFLYVRYADGEREYYDLLRDPFELDNLARSLRPSRRAQLDHWVADLTRCTAADCFTAAVRPPAA